MARSPNISPQTRRLLAALLEQPQAWRHGYDLSKLTGLKSGTLYPILMRLSEQGLVEAEWREPLRVGRPARHVYRLTTSGLALAKAQAAEAAVTQSAAREALA
ncbi:MAG: PadR family transcriptional regulator [Caulobacterales bacterium 68-7]|nr:MAG: PadR family transcriptional regulator [Caulobacterales bacterium 68-7]